MDKVCKMLRLGSNNLYAQSTLQYFRLPLIFQILLPLRHVVFHLTSRVTKFILIGVNDTVDLSVADGAAVQENRARHIDV